MLIIAEKINIMSKTIGPAMRERNAKPIQELAIAQVEGGAKALDLNLGPATKDGPAMMEWLVKTVEEAVGDSAQLCLDTKNIEAMEAGLKAITKRKPIINSTNADLDVLDKYMPMAANFDADIIALTMTSAGIPRDANERLENAAMIMAKAMEHGVALDRIYLDPLILPIGVAQQDAMEVVKTIQQFQMLNDPPMKSVVGLSNIYNGTPKELHSRFGYTFLAMLGAAGLTAAIADSLDKNLMAVARTIEIFRNEMLYAASYLDDILVKA
ncbi:MAG: dihydropteroate synthase [Actinomycetota bacterium]|nr:dihydropteroate synthase [Actinomycetota bacterium]